MENMKRYKMMSSLLLALLVMMLVNCKKDNDPELSGQQKAAQKLSATWGDTEVLSSPGGSYGTLEDLTLTFEMNSNLEPAGFSTTGASDYFLSGDNSFWLWRDATSTGVIHLINVSPVQELAILEFTDTTLTISFVYSGPEGGRVSGIGEYKVRLMRQ